MHITNMVFDMSKIKWVTLFFITVSFSCSDSTSISELESLRFDQSIGCYWKYNNPGLGTYNNSNSFTTKEIIGTDTLVNGEVVTKSRSINIDPTRLDTSIYYSLNAFKNDGYYSYQDYWDTTGTLLIRFPLHEGDTWISNENTFTVLSLNEDFDNYKNCVKIESNDNAYGDGWLKYFSYWKDGVGLVRSEGRIERDQMSLTMTYAILLEHGKK